MQLRGIHWVAEITWFEAVRIGTFNPSVRGHCIGRLLLHGCCAAVVTRPTMMRPPELAVFFVAAPSVRRSLQGRQRRRCQCPRRDVVLHWLRWLGRSICAEWRCRRRRRTEKGRRKNASTAVAATAATAAAAAAAATATAVRRGTGLVIYLFSYLLLVRVKILRCLASLAAVASVVRNRSSTLVVFSRCVPLLPNGCEFDVTKEKERPSERGGCRAGHLRWRSQATTV